MSGVCATNSAFSLRKLWANSERDTIVPLSSVVCNSALGIFKIHIFIMREKRRRLSPRICVSLGNCMSPTQQQMSNLKTPLDVFLRVVSQRIWKLADDQTTFWCFNPPPALRNNDNIKVITTIWTCILQHLEITSLSFINTSMSPAPGLSFNVTY